MTVLAVDDDLNIREFIADYLEISGYKVIKAQDALEALHHLKKNPDISLILSDINMPVMSGLDLAEAVHELKPHMPIILISGYSEAFDISKVESFIHCVISKPFELDTIAETIQAAIEHNSRGGSLKR